MSTRIILARTAAVLVLASAAPAFAHPAPDANGMSQSMTIQLGDINLHSAAGAKAALARIKAAATVVCGDGYADRSYSERVQVRRCRVAAINEAVARTNQPMLSALAQGAPIAQVASR